MATRRFAHVLSIACVLLLGGCAAPVDGTPSLPDSFACGKCDGATDGALLDLSIPGEAAVARLTQDALRGDGLVDEDEAGALAAFLRRLGGRNERVAVFLGALLDSDALTDGARAVLEDRLSDARAGDVPLENDVYAVVLGRSDFLFDDALYLRADGSVEGHTGLVSHSRGYAAKRDGVLFTRHGSRAPQRAAVDSPASSEVLRTQGPDAALDRAAEIYGVPLDAWGTFGHIARDPAYYDPSSATPYWAGICQGWTHNALDDRLNRLVDVPGDEGARGLWIFGQWISRADLGNALMGVSYSLGIADSTTIDSFVTPESLVKALAQHVLRSGVGLRVDIWNDAHNQTGRYDAQVWNQPIVGARLEVASVSPATAEAVLAHAAAEPRLSGGLPEGASVRLVRAAATWGVEADDAWEGEPLYQESKWNMYMVTDADGRVIRAYMAYDLTAASVHPLPVTESDGLPDYLALPRHELTDAAFGGAPHRLLGGTHSDGLRFRFLVGTVLARGIPEPTRLAFEEETLSGASDPEDLAARYPGIANAYAPEEWERVFAPVVGPGEAFGAVWGGDSTDRP